MDRDVVGSARWDRSKKVMERRARFQTPTTLCSPPHPGVDAWRTFPRLVSTRQEMFEEKKMAVFAFRSKVKHLKLSCILNYGELYLYVTFCRPLTSSFPSFSGESFFAPSIAQRIIVLETKTQSISTQYSFLCFIPRFTCHLLWQQFKSLPS